MTVHHGSNLVVTTEQELAALVEEVLGQAAFCFDVETRGDISRHQDLQEIMEGDLARHISSLKSPTEINREKAKARFARDYRKRIALDPLRNEMFWIGIAISGRSWAIPMGHRHGELIEPEEIGDGTTVPPPGYRKLTSTGRESKAKARYHKPAVFGPPPPQLSRDVVLEALRPLFFGGLIKVGHNVKFDARTIGKYYGEIPPGPYVDTMMLQHYLDENLPTYSLERLISLNFGGHDAYYRHGKLGKQIDEVAFDQAALYQHLDVRWTWLVYCRLYSRVLAVPGLEESFEQEMETLRVLMRMEDAGIPVDYKAMERLGAELDVQMREIKAEIARLSYVGFNPDSTVHKRDFIFGPKDKGNLGLRPSKLTKGGVPSTDDEVLKGLASKHPLIGKILEWQEVRKLKGTYVDGMLPKLNDGRLHPNFNLHRTTTGRLSSSDPNLQNIPRGDRLRSMFVAAPGCELLVADYSQIELRYMAIYSGDRALTRIFQDGVDLHAGTAAVVFSKDVEDVTHEERQLGKTINFLTGYGGGAKLLAARAGISVKDAKRVLDDYNKQFAGLTKWKNDVVRKARTKGYVTTWSGRRRRLPDINHKDDQVRSRAERQAVNAIIQGSASDLAKAAMIEVDRLTADTPARLLLQVHDELVMMAPEGETEYYSSLLTKGMGHGTIIEGVPLVAECHAAHSWAEAKG